MFSLQKQQPKSTLSETQRPAVALIAVPYIYMHLGEPFRSLQFTFDEFIYEIDSTEHTV